MLKRKRKSNNVLDIFLKIFLEFWIKFLIKFYLISVVLGISLLKVAAILSGPVAIVKTFISLIHAYVAAQNLAIIDGNEREIIRQNELAKKPE